MQGLQHVAPFEGYIEQQAPLGSYAALVAGWTAVAGAGLALARREEDLPARAAWSDLALVGLATHKITRILARDWVTAPLRAPFTRYKETTTAGEQTDVARGEGPRKAIGDLITCQWCLGPWVAAVLMTTLAVRPRETRFVAGMFAAVAISDWLHVAYERAKPAASHDASRNGGG